MPSQRVLARSDNKHTLLSKETQDEIREEINELLNNKNTQIGTKGANIVQEKHLKHKSIFILSDVSDVTPKMYGEVETYLGKGFSLHVGQVTLPTFGSIGHGMGKQMCISIEYIDIGATVTIASLWVLFVIGMYITPWISYMGSFVGLLQTPGWITTILINAIATAIMFGAISMIKSVPKLRLVYDIYFMDLKTSTHLLIGLIGALVYQMIFFIIHTKDDSSMFGSLFRLVG